MKKKYIVIYIMIFIILILLFMLLDNFFPLETLRKDVNYDSDYAIKAFSVEETDNTIIFTAYNEYTPPRQETVYYFENGLLTNIEYKKYYNNKYLAKNALKFEKTFDAKVEKNVFSYYCIYEEDIGKTKQEILDNIYNMFGQFPEI